MDNRESLQVHDASIIKIHIDLEDLNNYDSRMSTNFVRRTTRILVLNPNSSASMTHGVEEAIRGMNLPQSVEIFTYTAPSESPASINDGDDVAKSERVVFHNLEETGILRDYDAVLVACFSVHPLVDRIADAYPHLVVTGIFEAGILAALSLLPHVINTWGIVTTGKYWEKHLSDGVHEFLGGGSSNSRFAGVETTGLNAGDFHGGVDPAEIRRRLREATKRLLDRHARAVIMGCAGMAGLEDIIREVATEERGVQGGKDLLVIDGVKAGIGLLEQGVRNKRMFQRA
ncbi:Asp/Glu/hydantoin racemase [Cladorrhinum sp. PSN259]|nr:Asp/Glu/hydantoin racemase [Cladorrhinum sp. PSN259]